MVATKLFVPPPRPDLVPRPRIDERLNAGLRRKLTLLAAPAGFGKTTVLSAWRVGPVARAVPLAWVSLDAGDNDPVRFWTYVSLALDAVHAGVGRSALGLLQAPHPPPTEAVLTLLLNRLASVPCDVALVLDDYHAIDAAPIHQSLVFLLDHLPPQLHVIVATRADPPLPLAQLRARGELVELRAADLRFTPDETSRFFAEDRALPLTDRDIAVLAARTEGWIAALHLAALSLQGREDAAEFVRAFAGSHRFLVDYLAEEVLSRQPPDIQSFLLDTAILDRMSGPLCDALSGRSDGQVVLERLERTNLFTVPLDDQRRWYRYHHLFAEFLRARATATSPDRAAELHGRAAAWHEREGFLPEAVGHALAGRDVERAARLVEQAAESMWKRGELATLLGWLEALPRAAVRARPRLVLAHAGAHFLARSYDADAVNGLLAEAEAALGPDPDAGESDGPRAVAEEQRELRGILAAIRAAVATTVQDVPATIAFARQALEALPVDRAFWRIVATVSLGLAYNASGDAAAGPALTEALALSQRSGNRYLALVATMNLARVRATEGRLHVAADLCRRGLALAAEQGGGGGRLPVAGYCHVQLGKLLYEWNDLEAATRHQLEGIAQVRQEDEQLRVLIDGHAALARIKLVEGDADGADEMLRRCEQAAQASRLPWARPLAAAYRARLDVQRGNLAAGIRWAEEARLRPDDEPIYFQEFAHLTLARILIARGEPATAIALLTRLHCAAASAGRTPRVIEADILRAVARHAEGDEAGKLAVLESALALAEPEGYVRLFVDEGTPLAALLAQLRSAHRRTGLDAKTQALRAYTDRLLAAFAPAVAGSGPVACGQSTGEPSAPLREPLTPREREVVRLMAEGLSNSEIAARLFITVGTVKSYVNGIFGKLGAVSRTQAVARAGTLGLLSDENSRLR